MKIAVWHNLPSGGGKRALFDHVRGLLARGHVVEAWCPATADREFLPLSELIPEHVLPFARPSPPRTFAQKVRWAMAEPAATLREMDRHCRACAAQIEAGGFDVLLANACMFFRAPAIGRYLRIPKALYLQEPYRWLYEALPKLPWVALPPPARAAEIPRWLVRRIEDGFRVRGSRLQVREELESAKAFDAILVNSLYSRESVLRAYGIDARVCYLGIDLARLRAPEGGRETFVAGVGAFVPEKNVAFVIEALARVSPPRPALVWIGNVAIPEHLEELRRLAARMGVELVPKVRASEADVVETLGKAAMLAYAPRLEPFGLAPLEANACGTPVVAVAEGGVRETVEDGVNGLLVEPHPDRMAEAISRLRDDPKLARSLGENGRRRVQEKWTLELATSRLERQLEEIVREAGSRRRG